MRSGMLMLAMGLALGIVTNHAAAQASKIATSMGDLRWGMSESEVTSFLKRKLEERYSAQLAKTKDAGKQSQLRAELKRSVSDMQKSLTEFNGSRSRWDNSPVAGEFTYNNNESMIVASDENSQNYYFFVNGRLWKWYKALDKSKVGDFKKFSASVEGKFGKGRAKKGEVAPGQGDTQFIEYLDRNSRLRAADNSKHGVYALIFDEMAMVRELASTRPMKPSRLAGQSEDEVSQPKNMLKGDDNEVAKAQTKRSVFGNEQHQETEAEYEARNKKAASEARDRQLRAHQRQEETKKGEVLKQLDGLNDSDPLGGL